RRRHTRSKRDWSSDVCSSDLGYDDAWIAEAKKRGLYNLASTPDALPHYTDKKNLQLFTRHGVYTPVEVGSREEILLEEYSKTIQIGRASCREREEGPQVAGEW